MTTVINTPSNDSGSGSAGWAVAVIILLLVIVVGYFGVQQFGGSTAAPSADINVNLPENVSVPDSIPGTTGQ